MGYSLKFITVFNLSSPEVMGKKTVCEHGIKGNELSFSRPNNLNKAQESFRDLSYGNWFTALNSCCDFVHSQLKMQCGNLCATERIKVIAHMFL
jgi:hypothetical protein